MTTSGIASTSPAAKQIDRADVLGELKKRVLSNIAYLNDVVATIDAARANHKPAAGSWSALECIQHLNLVNRHYIAETEKKLKGLPDSPQSSYSSSFMGRQFVKTVHPDTIGKKTPTLGSMKPEQSELNQKAVCDEAVAHSERLLAMIETAATKDLGGVRVKSVIGPIIRFKLGDVLRIITLHDQRHIQQAKNAIAAAS